MRNLLLKFLCCITLSYSLAGFTEPLATYQQQVKALKGQVIYVDFWASWCSPCRRSLPWLTQLQTKYHAQQFTVLSINVDNDEQLAKQVLTELPVNFPVIYDSSGELMHALNITGMPSSLLLDRNGKLVAKHAGFNAKKQQAYEQEIVALLNSSAP